MLLIDIITHDRLELSVKQHTRRLRKKNRIKTLAGTLEIEGNFLGEEKITALVDGKRVLGTTVEVAEVQGAIKAYQELENYKYNKIDDLLYAHKILNVRVGEHIAPQAHLVPQLMTQLFKWLKESDEHMILKSSIFHYEFEFIHPFSDGNGRMGRLWQSVILHAYNPLFSSLPTESIVRDNQQEYYKALENATPLGESTPFIEFMLEIILESIIKVGNLTDNQIMIIQMMKDNSKVSAKLLSDEVVSLLER